MSSPDSNPQDIEEIDVREQTRQLIGQMAEGPIGRSLVTVLQQVQAELGYLSREALLTVAEELEVPAARVYGVATFYNQFRFTPPGRHPIRVCMGTACAIKLGNVVLQSWERRLGIAEGETTEDREYSLERVACVGCCSLAPVAIVGDDVHGHMSPTKVDGILLQHEMQRQKDAQAAAAEAPTETPAAEPTEEAPEDGAS